MGFSTPSYDLIDLFARIDRGDVQLPDFQRDYSWDVDRIRALIVTVLRGYPIGCLMALDTRNDAMRFRPRPLDGAPNTGENPGLLLLDGQQRLTALYQSLRGDGLVDTVDFRSKRIKRKFYVNVDKALSADIMPDEAVFAINEHGKVMSNFADKIPGGVTGRTTALNAGVIPVSALLSDEGTDMLFEFAEAAEPGARERAKHFHNTVAKPLARYAIPMIRLDRETAHGGVGSIFAHANSAGVQMDVFDLLTAAFAQENPDFRLRDDWAEIEAVLRRHPALDGVGSTEFLIAVTLLVTAERGHAAGQREDVLRLDLNSYCAAAARVCAAFEQAANFLADHCIFSNTQVPYIGQLIPLATILALLAKDKQVFETQQAWDRLNCWFWCGIFGELYGSANVPNRTARDVQEVTAWVQDAAHSAQTLPEESTPIQIPATVQDARFIESRLLSVGPESGVYKGIYALIMARGAKDWRTAEPFNVETFDELAVHFHPIFPAQWSAEHGVASVLVHSVLNHTPMGRRTEAALADTPPTRYIPRIQFKSLMDDVEFNEVLQGHLLDPTLLREAKAAEFFADRRQQLLDMVEEAMGKAAVHDVDESDLHGGEEGPNAFR